MTVTPTESATAPSDTLYRHKMVLAIIRGRAEGWTDDEIADAILGLTVQQQSESYFDQMLEECDGLFNGSTQPLATEGSASVPAGADAIERVARALCDEDDEYPDADYGDRRKMWELYKSAAKVAIEEISATEEEPRSDAGGWRPIESAPFMFDSTFEPPTRWLSWCLLGRRDEHGWVEWVGGMDGDVWLGRNENRACWECKEPTHFFAYPSPPEGAEKP